MAIATLRRDDAVFARWSRRVRLPREALPLFELIPPSAAGPLFLDPVSDGFDDGLDKVLSTPHDQARAQLMEAARPTPWARGLATRDRDAWRTLENALRRAYDAVIEAERERIRASFHADLAWAGWSSPNRASAPPWPASTPGHAGTARRWRSTFRRRANTPPEDAASRCCRPPSGAAAR